MTELSESILRLRLEGRSYREIESLLGCSKGTIAYHCGAGQKQKAISGGRDRRNVVKKFLQEFKRDKPCADCGENYPYWMMQYDHLRDKRYAIAGMANLTVSLEVVKEEIEKCEIVCANCHANRTFWRARKTGTTGELIPPGPRDGS